MYKAMVSKKFYLLFVAGLEVLLLYFKSAWIPLAKIVLLQPTTGLYFYQQTAGVGNPLWETRCGAKFSWAFEAKLTG